MCTGLAKEPLVYAPPPDYPFQGAVAGWLYLAYACRLSGWLELAYFTSSPTSRDIINVMREFFQRFGMPEELSLDGGPNLKSQEFLSFMNAWGIKRRLSSAYYVQSNGRAEAAVKTAKRIISGNTGRSGKLDTDKVARALLNYRNTPIKGTGVSPAQLLMGRNLRDFVP